MGDEEDGGGGFYSKFASKLGSGAAKVGKRAAQSEAGRKATRSAVRGATDSIHDDINRRYSEERDPLSPTSLKSPTKSEPPKTTTTTSTAPTASDSTPEQSPDMGRKEYQQYRSSTQSHDHSSSQQQYHHESRPAKPSFFSKLKRSKSPPRTRRVVAQKRDPKDRIYKSRLAKEANWDQLPLAQALYHYKAEMKCDLEFRKGQIIRVMTRTDTQFDWWEGKLEDRVGIFPANYVKLM